MAGKTLTKKAFNSYVERIENTKSIEDLKKIGKELMDYSACAYKKAILEIYSERKKALINNVLNSSESLRIIKNYLLFSTDENVRKAISRVLYALGQDKFADPAVVSYLLDIYKQGPITKKENETPEV